MIDMRIIFMKFFIFKRPALIFGLAFVCYFILAQASEARTNLLIVDESQQYQGIGKDFSEAAKTRLSRMGYTILNKTKTNNIYSQTIDNGAGTRVSYS